MTVTITIEARPDRGDLRQQIEDGMAGLGFYPSKSSSEPVCNPVYGSSIPPMPDKMLLSQESESTTVLDEPSVQKVVRERGQPGPGRKRRTKEEIAEDAAADAAENGNTAQAISSGEERISPEDDEKTIAQDAADEQAEAKRTSTGKPTLDDVRKVVGLYQKQFGMQDAIANIPKILGKGIVELTDDEIPAAIAKIEKATSKAPAEAKTEAEILPPEPVKTYAKSDVQTVMMQYAKKYDGLGADPSDATSLPFTLEDAPKVFEMVCGTGVRKLSDIPVEKYGAVIAGLTEMLEKDPFKRGAK